MHTLEIYRNARNMLKKGKKMMRYMRIGKQTEHCGGGGTLYKNRQAVQPDCEVCEGQLKLTLTYRLQNIQQNIGGQPIPAGGGGQAIPVGGGELTTDLAAVTLRSIYGLLKSAALQ